MWNDAVHEWLRLQNASVGYSLENEHGTWKWTPGKADSGLGNHHHYHSFSGFILVIEGVCLFQHFGCWKSYWKPALNRIAIGVSGILCRKETRGGEMEGKVGYENCRSECLSNKNEDSNLRTCMATEWNDQNYKYHTSIFSCWTFFSLTRNTSYVYLTTFIHDSWVSKIMFVVPKKIMKSSEPAQIKADEEARLQQLEEQSGCKEKFHSPKINVEPENWWFVHVVPFPRCLFAGSMFVFGGVSL